MDRTIRIRERFALLHKRNPISGHEWTEHGPTTSYETVGIAGVVSWHRTLAGAEKSRAEWQEYYDSVDRLGGPA